jgi:hypothetical protein
MRWFVAIAAAGLAAAQELAPLAPEVLQLARIRERMMLNLARQPNYTCVETVERSHRSGVTRKFQVVDTIRLEVALVDGKEMFAWPGSRKFEDSELRDIVTTGAIGNGNFAIHARAVFQGNNAQFEYRGEADGAVRYDFRVPQNLSGYNIRVETREAVVGYHGSFWADGKSLDVRRLEIIADDIPVTLGLSSASDRMDYSRVVIGDREFLLVSSSELQMTDLAGGENRNRVRFAACRQFSGESMLTFDEAPKAAEKAPMPVEEIALPPGLGLRLTTLDDIDLRSAAVGDPVHARLENDLRYKGRLLFAKGATVTGRISRMERHENYTAVGIEWLELESERARARLKAKLEEVIGLNPGAPRNQQGRGREANPGEGIIPVDSSRARLSHGILMFWRT